VAQLVGDERRSLLSPKRQRTENPCVGSSILSSTTKKIANNQGNGLLAIFALWGVRVGEIDGKTVFYESCVTAFIGFIPLPNFPI